MRIPFRLALLATIPLGAVSTAAHAEENLGTMTISANRTATDIARSGSSVTVITAEEIEKQQAVTALDAIKEVPGVLVSGYGGIGKGTMISIRGVREKGILILIDGIPTADTSSIDRSYDLTNLLAEDIARIEVLRGNQSTLYGSSAVGGVISITTKTGKGTGKTMTGSGGAEWGSYGTGKTDVNMRGETGNVYYGGSVAGLTTQGFDISRSGPDEDDGYKNLSANLKIGTDLVRNAGAVDRLNIEGVGRYLKAHNSIDTYDFATSSIADDDLETRTIEQAGRFSVNLDLFHGILANSLSAAQTTTRRDYYDGGQRDMDVYGTYDGEITKYEYQGTLKPIEDHTLVFGLDRQREHATLDNTYGPMTASATNDGAYGNYILDLTDDLTVTAGIRHDDHETFGGHTTWRSTASYRIPETGTRFHGGYGTAFRAPSLYQLYAPADSYGNTNGNPGLKPEESKGYDFGFEQSVLDDRLTFGSTFFNSRTQDAIDWQNGGYVNIASARSFGFENSMAAEITDEIKLSVNYTYLQSRDNSTGQTLVVSPRHTGNARLTYSPSEVEGLDTWVATRSATASYDPQGTKSYVGGYMLWDLGAAYAVTEWASVYGRVENLADKTYQLRNGYEQGGRAAYVGFRAKF